MSLVSVVLFSGCVKGFIQVAMSKCVVGYSERFFNVQRKNARTFVMHLSFVMHLPDLLVKSVSFSLFQKIIFLAFVVIVRFRGILHVCKCVTFLSVLKLCLLDTRAYHRVFFYRSASLHWSFLWMWLVSRLDMMV